MATRYNNDIGRILIDEDACRNDINRLRNAVTTLESANRKLRLIYNDSVSNFAGRTGDSFRTAIEERERKNNESINSLNATIGLIVSTINRYINADTQLAERFRREC